MSLYVTRCLLSINGTDITDFKSFTEKSRSIRKKVNLMYKSGTADLTQRFEASLEYVIPRDKPEFNFDGVEGGTLVVDFEGGEQVRFGGVACKEVSDVKIDGETEAIRTVDLICETRNGATGS